MIAAAVAAACPTAQARAEGIKQELLQIPAVIGGRTYQLEGLVLTRTCRPVAGVLLDLWHANENGDYDDSGFRYRGHLFSDAAGRYRFRTILPGLYPGRTRHYHLKVQAPRQRLLTTQLYFPNEPRNGIDEFFSPQLLMHISQASPLTSAHFDFILNV